ncbi:MAG TPA: hypothetical protein PKX28_07855 [Candidatus Hydrogenedentes bacterium]|nr:hypothetical protein [Candidatus Hydrogenedentota bacterium]HOJ67572.1 hypothetical protein [Candidatus Hydrogenedentota bacterium]HOK89847.1 hypothetical protein [Candidatus Hydrogenedentota bacterium]HPO31140.1 hypothetical protein [Candidatus Hydrogenedentota bacterium]
MTRHYGMLWRYGVMCLMTAAAAIAQDTQTDLGGYTSMEIEAGRMKGNFATGAIDEMTDGVKIRLLSDRPDLKPLPISARSMKFTWTEGKNVPDRILMEGNVEVTHPDAAITADRAEWNFKTGELVFSGNPVVNNDRIKGLRGERMTLNLKTNTFEVSRVRADQVPLQAGEATGAPGETAPGLLAESDITDWGALVGALRKEAGAKTPSPGQRILSLLADDERATLMSLDTAVLLKRKEDMLKLINRLLRRPDLYDAGAWGGVTLPDEIRQLLGQGQTLSPDEQVRLNRLLLHAAYPELVKAP